MWALLHPRQGANLALGLLPGNLPDTLRSVSRPVKIGDSPKMTTQMQLTYNDRSNEKSTLSIAFATIAAGGGNFDTVLASMNTVEAAIDAMTLCDNSKQAFYGLMSQGEDIPTSPYAQRELGVRVFFVDDVNGEKGHFTIPGPDLASLEVLPNTDQLDLTGTLEAALVTALEANALSRDGNAITVQRMVIVGRRS